MHSVERVNIRRYEDGEWATAEDQLAVEEPMELRLHYGPAAARITKAVSVTMRTPGDDPALGAGFLFTEGILHHPTQIAAISEAAANTLLVDLVEGEVPMLHGAERNFYTTSSCGVCGKSSLEAIRTQSQYSSSLDDLSLPAKLFCLLPGQLREQQNVFNSTGGLHASALFSSSGQILSLREDVGRHNALDKLIGAAFLEDRLPLNKSILLLSGRASFELIQKASMAGIRVVAAVGAPSSLAMQLASEQDITLIGFLRGARFNIYTHSRRISH